MNSTEYQKQPIFKYDQKERVISFNIVGLYLCIFLVIIDLLVMIFGFFGPFAYWLANNATFITDDFTLKLYKLRASTGIVEYYEYLCIAFPGTLTFGSIVYGAIRAIWIHMRMKKDKDTFNF